MAEESTTLKSTPGEDGSPIWARLAGFPLWPARLCSKQEEESIMKLKAGKLKQVAVLFLGRRCDKGWVQDNSVCSFAPATLSEKFLPKKFKGDKDYRAATVEAVRLAMLRGTEFDETFMELINSCNQDFPLILRDTESCGACGGGCMSGPLMACQVCDKAQRHWHCFAQADEGAWMCETCCKNQGLPVGSIVPFEEDAQDKTPSAVVASVVTEKSSSRSSSAKPPLSAPTSSSGVNAAAGAGGGGSSNNARSHKSATPSSGASLIKKVNTIINSTSMDATPASKKDKAANSNKVNSLMHSDEAAELEPGASPAADRGADADADGIDDQCFVCGMGGHLLLCDYPQCTRAYHQICVARIFPESLDTQMCVDDGQGHLLGATTFNEPWFCPCHTCIGCHALQATESTLAVQDIPFALYERQKLAMHCAGASLPGKSSSVNAGSSGGRVRQKALRGCSGCPVSVCDECENVLSSGQNLLHEKRFTEKLECPNCSTRDPTMKLARLLERAWVRSVNTRLALPFLRPLLPLPAPASTPVTALGCVSGSNIATAVEDGVNASHITSAVEPILHSNGSAESGSTEYFSSLDLPARSKKRKGPAGRTLELPATLANSNGHSNSSESCEDGSHGANNNSVGGDKSDGTLQSAKAAWLAVMQATKPAYAKRTKTHHTSCEENNKPTDLIGVLEKIHRALYSTVREYYSDLNHIRNLLKTKIEGHYRDTATTEAAAHEILSRHSVLLAFDTVIDSSYTFLSDKLLRISELEQRIRDHSVDDADTPADSIAVHPNGVPNTEPSAAVQCNSAGQCLPEETDPACMDTSDPHVWDSLAFLVPLHAEPASPSQSAGVASTDAPATAPVEAAPAVRTRRSLHISTAGAAAANKPVTFATPQVAALMKSLWRVECTHLVPSTAVLKALSSQNAAATVASVAPGAAIPSSSDLNTANIPTALPSPPVPSAAAFQITPRSLSSWTAYIEQGRFPSEHRGTSDPYSMRSTIAANEALHSEKGLMQNKAREMLYGCGDPQFAKYMTSEMEAAQLMMGMSHSGLRESVTLFEGAPSVADQHSRFSSYHNHQYDQQFGGAGGASSSSGGSAMLVEDEALVMLDRLRDVTQRAVQLQERLRESHMAKQRAILSTDTDVITIGQASVLTEMKIANDNLRWRLQQKDSLVAAQKVIITSLQAQLAESQEKLKQAEDKQQPESAAGINMDVI